MGLRDLPTLPAYVLAGEAGPQSVQVDPVTPPKRTDMNTVTHPQDSCHPVLLFQVRFRQFVTFLVTQFWCSTLFL